LCHIIQYSSENKQLFTRNAGQDLVMRAKSCHNSAHVAYFRDGCLFRMNTANIRRNGSLNEFSQTIMGVTKSIINFFYLDNVEFGRLIN
jgi:hypothetical protein